MKKLVFVTLVTCVLPFLAMAQFQLSGTISDKSSNAPLSDANIRLKNSSKFTSSAKNGSFKFENVKAGDYELQVSHLGFEIAVIKIHLSANLQLNVALQALNFMAEEVLVQSTRVNRKGSVTFKNVSKADIESQNFGQDLPFIIQNTPGVVVTSDAGAGVGYTGIRVRGSDASRINVTINGIPYNDSESQGTFWVNMPDFASSVDNIQIQRGLGTSTNGAGSFGGSLNIQTSAISDVPYAELSNSFGSFGTMKNTLKVGTGLIGNFNFEGRLSNIESDGFIDRAKSGLQSYFLSGSYKTEKQVVRVNVFAGKEQTYQAWNGVPEAKLKGSSQDILDYADRNYVFGEDLTNLLSANPRTYNSFLYKDQTDNYWQKHYQILYAYELSEKLKLNLAGHYTDGKGYFEEFKANQKFSNYGLTPITIGNTLIDRTDLVRRRWLDNDFYGATYSLSFEDKKWSWILGGAYNQYVGDHFGQVISANFGNAFETDRHYYDNVGRKNDFNMYAKASFALTEKLNLFGDLQYRNVYYKVTGLDKNLNTLNVKDELNFVNPKMGFSYSFTPEQVLYTSVAFATKEPNRDDYINLNQNILPLPESMLNAEAGYRLEKGGLSFGFNAYGMFYKDQLIVNGKINEVGEYLRQNVDKSYRMGLELDASYTLSPKFKILTNAALSKNKIDSYTDYSDDYDNGGQFEERFSNTDISFSPSLVLGSELVYQPAKGLGIALQSRYVSKQYLDNTQNENRKLDAYFVNNLRMGYDFSALGIKKLSIGVLVNNLFDHCYESNGYTFGYYAGGSRTTENFYFPQAGRHFITSLTVKF